MRTTSFLGVFVLATFALPAVAGGWTIKPGKVTVDPASPGRISGTFSLVPDRDGPAGRTGGACLIYQPQPPRQRKSCETAADCSVGSAPGYCATEGPGEPARTKSCWAKRANDCRKSPSVGLPEQVPQSLPVVAAHALPAPAPAAVRWRVVTCQNLTGMGCGSPTGIEGVNKRTRYGPVKVVPLKEIRQSIRQQQTAAMTTISMARNFAPSRHCAARFHMSSRPNSASATPNSLDVLAGLLAQ